MSRVILAIMLSFSLLMSSVNLVSAAPESTYSEQDYVTYLTDLGKTDPEALRVKEQFEALSPKKKKKFLYYISNPEVIMEALSTPLGENSKKELYSGDVVIERKTETTIIEEEEQTQKSSLLTAISSVFCNSCFAAPSIKTIRLTDVRHLVVKDISVSKFTVWVLYSVQGNQVKSIKGGNGSVKNLWPYTIEKESVSKYIHGGKAQTCVLWKIKPILLGKIDLGFMNRSLHHDVIGFPTGKKSYRFYED